MKAGKDYIGVGCGALIVNDKNQTLLLLRGAKSKNEAGFWNQPGGAVEFGEKIEEAVLREIKEELDIEIKIIKFLVFTDQILKTEGQHWVALSFLAKIEKGQPKIMEPEKIAQIKWFNLNDPPEKLTQTTKDSIKAYLSKERF